MVQCDWPQLDWLLSLARPQEELISESGTRHFLDHLLLHGRSEEKKIVGLLVKS